MPVALLQTPTLQLEKGMGFPAVQERRYTRDEPAPVVAEDDVEQPGQFDIWSAIQGQKAVIADAPAAPYVHPLLRRSSSSLSQLSLQTCTESLGSETGSDDFSPFDHVLDLSSQVELETEQEDANLEHANEETEELEFPRRRTKELTSINYHCSISWRSPLRAFPPPLPSISRRDGPCIHMRPHRRDGRLVVEAVAVPSRNYLHAHREGGRLLLSFVDAATVNHPIYGDDAASDTIDIEQTQRLQHELDDTENNEAADEERAEVEDNNCDEEEEQDEEEQVEVLDRGTVVEVKVSTQPQKQNGGSMKVLRSSLVINKFVGGTPDDVGGKGNISIRSQFPAAPSWAPVARRPTTVTAAAAAAVAASTLIPDGDDSRLPAFDSKLLFTAKRRNRGEMLRTVRCYSLLRRPLFILEPCCIATSS